MVVVLGDIGRSPRIQYHAASLAANPAGCVVDLVGYPGAPVLPAVRDLVARGRIRLHHVPVPAKLPAVGTRPSALGRVVYMVKAVLRVVRQMLGLAWLVLFELPKPDCILIQNPPAIPTLFLAQLVRWLRFSRLVIDWHNFGYTIMELNLGKRSSLVGVARWYERTFGRDAEGHLCVTSAMARELKENWGVSGEVAVLHDRAPQHFKRLSLDEAHEVRENFTPHQAFPHPSFLHTTTKFLGKLVFGTATVEYATASPTSTTSATTIATTLLTHKPAGDAAAAAAYRPRRPALVVSSTSWTEDEDFSLLLSAAVQYDARVEVEADVAAATADDGHRRLPELVIVITGKGPLRDRYVRQVSRLGLRHCRILTAWLENEDYPKLLGCADLGVSLHTSSSGLDLPMKVVDMMGCGLPACAVGYPCIDELVQHRQNGMVFSTAEELASQFVELFTDFDDAPPRLLNSLREGTRRFQGQRWQENWERSARRVILGGGGGVRVA
ncbi:glycosyl transferases group 1-domain-containing protein [Zopfochytrium polystomum]|nr:glycosyl transferases group 1-domain-containing protein [Zopfochytrium polystomum]